MCKNINIVEWMIYELRQLCWHNDLKRCKYKCTCSFALMSQIYIVNIINKISATLLLAVLLFAKRFAGLDVITLLSTNENARGVLQLLVYCGFRGRLNAPNGTFCINTHDGCIIIVRETTRAQSGKLPGFSIYANGNFFFTRKTSDSVFKCIRDSTFYLKRDKKRSLIKPRKQKFGYSSGYL